jgi:hypothetical protein
MRINFQGGVVLVVLLSVAAASRADSNVYSEFAFGIGYAHLEVGGSSSALHSMDALRLDADLNFSPFEKLPQFRLGGAFGLSMVIDNSSRTIISNGGTVIITGSSEVPFLTLEPELRMSWRQPFEGTFFIEPGVGLGAAFAHLSLSSDNASLDKWGSCFDARVFLNIGLAAPGGHAGLQLSYMHGGPLDFGQNARGDLNQFYVGLFWGTKF